MILDKNGREIYSGDLVRTPHYRTKRKVFYLYHVVTKDGDKLKLLPVSWLDPNTDRSGGGSCYLFETLARTVEVIYGMGPDRKKLTTYWYDRPRHSED